MRLRSLVVLAALSAATAPSLHAAGPASWLDTLLWQEHNFWDALLQSRDRAARQQADPHLMPVVRAISQQTAQQALNLRQIAVYAKAQEDNLRFAFAQDDPSRSVATIRSNLDTLAKGAAQIHNNLFYLAARCRMASSQALPDPELTAAAAALIAQIQTVQINLNSLYADAVAVQGQIGAETWVRDKMLTYNAEALVRSVTSAQDSVFSVYNSAYELYMRSK